LRERQVSASAAMVTVTTGVSNNSPTARTVTVRTLLTDANNVLIGSTTSGPTSVAAKGNITTGQTLTIPHVHRWQGKADP
jgi:beta-galactosidase